MLHFEINNLPLPIVQYINIVLSRISDLQVLAADAVLAKLKSSAFFYFCRY